MNDSEQNWKELIKIDPVAGLQEKISKITEAPSTEASVHAMMTEIIDYRQKVIQAAEAWHQEKKKVRRREIAAEIGAVATAAGALAFAAYSIFGPPSIFSPKELPPYTRVYKPARFHIDAQIGRSHTWYALEETPERPVQLSIYFPGPDSSPGVRIRFKPELKDPLIHLIHLSEQADQPHLDGALEYAPRELTYILMQLSGNDGEITDDELKKGFTQLPSIHKTEPVSLLPVVPSATATPAAKPHNPEYTLVGKINGANVFAHNEQYTAHDGKTLDAVGLYYDDLATPVAFGKFESRALSASFAETMEKHASKFPTQDAVRKAYDEMDDGIHKKLLTNKEYADWFNHVLPRK